MLTTTVTMGSLTSLIPTILSKQQSCGTCTTKNSYDVPSTTKTTALPMTSTSYQWLMPCQQARERPTTSLRSHDVSGRLDTPRTSNQPLKSKTVAPTQVWLKMYSIAAHASEGNEDHMAGYFPLVMGKAPLLWLGNLPAECITSSVTLSRLFTTNYQATYNRPGNTHHLTRV
jgi:hypothetical protein